MATNRFYYSALNAIYIVILASINAPSFGYYWRMRKRHNRRPPVVERQADLCEMRRGYCRRCGPLGTKCAITGKVTARWAVENLLETLQRY